MAEMNEKSRISVLKLSEFLSTISVYEIHEYIDKGGLNLTLISQEAGVTRSVLYQNPHVKKVIKEFASTHKNHLDKMPYEDKSQTSEDGIVQRSRANLEMAKLMEQSRKDQNKISELQAEVSSLRGKLKQYASIEEVLENTGRMPR